MSWLLTGMCVELFFLYLNLCIFFFTFPLTILSIIMSVFSLNEILLLLLLIVCIPCLWSFLLLLLFWIFWLPLLSLVNLLKLFFNCILDLGSAHNLPADCVLGCDYLTCLSANLCEFFSVFFLILFHSTMPLF